MNKILQLSRLLFSVLLLIYGLTTTVLAQGDASVYKVEPLKEATKMPDGFPELVKTGDYEKDKANYEARVKEWENNSKQAELKSRMVSLQMNTSTLSSDEQQFERKEELHTASDISKDEIENRLSMMTLNDKGQKIIENILLFPPNMREYIRNNEYFFEIKTVTLSRVEYENSFSVEMKAEVDKHPDTYVFDVN